MRPTIRNIGVPNCFHQSKISKSFSLLDASINGIDKYLSSSEVFSTENDLDPLSWPIIELIIEFFGHKTLIFA